MSNQKSHSFLITTQKGIDSRKTYLAFTHIILISKIIMGCCTSKEMPSPQKLSELDAVDVVSRQHSTLSPLPTYASSNTYRPTGNSVIDTNVQMHAKYNSREKWNGDTDPASAVKNKHNRTRSGLSPIKMSNSLPWKAIVHTQFGKGEVTRIARREDGVAEVTLKDWTLANGAPVKIYAPSFAIKNKNNTLKNYTMYRYITAEEDVKRKQYLSQLTPSSKKACADNINRFEHGNVPKPPSKTRATFVGDTKSNEGSSSEKIAEDLPSTGTNVAVALEE